MPFIKSTLEERCGAMPGMPAALSREHLLRQSRGSDKLWSWGFGVYRVFFRGFGLGL